MATKPPATAVDFLNIVASVCPPISAKLDSMMGGLSLSVSFSVCHPLIHIGIWGDDIHSCIWDGCIHACF